MTETTMQFSLNRVECDILFCAVRAYGDTITEQPALRQVLRLELRLEAQRNKLAKKAGKEGQTDGN